MPAVEVDGNDVLALDELARELIDRVRHGDGPRFIWARTYRLAGHTAADAGWYRSEAELAERRQRDPLRLCEAWLRDAGLDEATLAARRELATAEIGRAFDAARAAPWPDVASAFTDVQDLGAPRAAGPHA